MEWWKYAHINTPTVEQTKLVMSANEKIINNENEWLGNSIVPSNRLHTF